MDRKPYFGDMPMFTDLIDFTNRTSLSGPGPDIALGSIDIITLAVFSSLSIIIFILTVYHIYLIAKAKEVPQIVTALSLHANTTKLFTVKNTDEMLCLHGIKSLSIIIIITGHSFYPYLFIPVSNRSDFVSFLSILYFRLPVQVFELAVDTFLVTGGFLACHSLLRSMDKNKKCNLLSFYLHRWLRLTPSLAVVVLANVGLINHLGSGPLWRNMDIFLVRNCRKYWWSTLLYLQNYVNPRDLCIIHTWHLSADMQLFMVVSLIILLMHRKKLLLYGLFGLISILSIVSGFIVAQFFDLYGLFTRNFLMDKFEQYVVYFYVPTHTRLAPYLFGAVLGHFVYTSKSSKKQITMSAVTVVSGWTVTAVLLIVCVYGEYFLQFTPNENLANAFYTSLVRPVWGAGICWMIFACVTENGGFVNDILSLPVFQILSRLSYNAFLVHFGFIFMGAFRIVAPAHFDLFSAVMDVAGYVMVSFGCSIVIKLFVDLPVSEIVKVVLKRNEAEEANKTMSQVGQDVNIAFGHNGLQDSSTMEKY